MSDDEEPEEPEMTPEGKPSPRIYKGEPRRVEDVAAQTIVQSLPEDRAQNKTLPLFMVVQDVQPSHRPGNLTVRYLNPRKTFVQGFVDLPKTSHLNVLKGRMGTTLANEVAVWTKINIGRRAATPGMQIGSDPEIFVVDGDGEIIPAFKFLPDKAKPVKSGYGETIYWDGFQAEFTTVAGGCLAYHCDSIHYGLRTVYEQAQKHNKKARLSLHSVLPVDPELLASGKDEHIEFGCMPSKNIYGMDGLKKSGRDVPFRFAGGHIHFGPTPLRYGDNGAKVIENTIPEIVKALDAILGVSCVSLFADWDNPVRRAYYGLPGEYRTPKHGLEYRSLSNAWLCHPVVMHLVFDLARRALAVGHNGLRHHWDASEDETITAVQTHDVGLARKILERNKDMWMGIMQFGTYYKSIVPFNAVMNGINSFIKDPADIVGNWKLTSEWRAHSDDNKACWVGQSGNIERGTKI
jgi:Phage phiEco32-like COOH.NH2 ligase-type 2